MTDEPRFRGDDVKKHGMNKQATLAAALLAACTVMAQSNALAQGSYPTRSVRFIVPLAAGGAADIIGRVAADSLSKTWGQPVVVENRPGAGTNVGVEALAKSAPDGYTIGQINVASHAINPALQKGKLPFNPQKDFEPITLLAISSNFLVVNPTKVPVKTVPELVAYAKAHPGQLNYASAGVGTTLHLGMEMFKDATGTDMVHVPYNSGATLISDLLSGRVDLAMDVAANNWQYVQGGKLRALAAVTPKRAAFAPDIPAANEYYPGLEITAWHGLGAPAGTPRAIVDKISADYARAVTAPEVQTKMKANYLIPASMKPDEFRAYITAEAAKWARAVEKSGASSN